MPMINETDLQMLLLIFAGFFVLSIVLLIAFVLFFVTLHKTLALCSNRNRMMEPGLVWLIFVPVFNYYWWFRIVIQMGRSLKNEFSERGNDDGSDYGRTLG